MNLLCCVVRSHTPMVDLAGRVAFTRLFGYFFVAKRISEGKDSREKVAGHKFSSV